MHYEHFSRYLREKYSTRLHILDELVDQIKQRKQLSKRHNKQTNRNIFEPYLNECILVAERIQNNQRSERDRQICYENIILAEKLERIRKQTGENFVKNYQNHCQLLPKKFNNDQRIIKTITKQFLIKSSEENHENINSYNSPSPIYSEGDISYLDNENDQATVADVDDSYSQIKSIHTTKMNRIYQHLTNIDMTLFENRSKHISNSFQSIQQTSKDRPCAFKKEILYH